MPNYAHFVLFGKGQILMPSVYNAGNRLLGIPEEVINTRFGKWFPYTYSSINLEGIIDDNAYSKEITVSGLLMTRDGKLYEIHLDTDDNLLSVNRVAGLYSDTPTTCCTRHGPEHSLATIFQMHPDITLEEGVRKICNLVMIRSTELIIIDAKEAIEKLQADERVIEPREVFKVLRDFNRRHDEALGYERVNQRLQLKQPTKPNAIK